MAFFLRIVSSPQSMNSLRCTSSSSSSSLEKVCHIFLLYAREGSSFPLSHPKRKCAQYPACVRTLLPFLFRNLLTMPWCRLLLRLSITCTCWLHAGFCLVLAAFPFVDFLFRLDDFSRRSSSLFSAHEVYLISLLGIIVQSCLDAIRIPRLST